MTQVNQVPDTRILAIELDTQERDYLLNMLRAELEDTRVEVRRTDTPSFQEGLHAQEHIIERLLAKIQASGHSTPPDTRGQAW